jgi:hypothetical protein
MKWRDENTNHRGSAACRAQRLRKEGYTMKKILILVTVAALCAAEPALAAGLPTPQDVEVQLKKLFPNEVGAEMFPKGNKFEVLFLSPDHPTSCLVDVATHRVSHCHFDDGAPGAPSPRTD